MKPPLNEATFWLTASAFVVYFAVFGNYLMSH